MMLQKPKTSWRSSFQPLGSWILESNMKETWVSQNIWPRTSSVMVVGMGIGGGIGELSWPSQEVGPPALPWASRMLCGWPGNNGPRQAGGPTLLPLVGGSDGPRSMLNVEILTQSWVSYLLAFNTSLVFNKKKKKPLFWCRKPIFHHLAYPYASCVSSSSTA